MKKSDLIEMFKGAKWKRNIADHSITADFRMDYQMMNSICSQTILFLGVSIEGRTQGYDQTTFTFKGEETLQKLVKEGFNNFPGATDYYAQVKGGG